jgi:hypothetical protein
MTDRRIRQEYVESAFRRHPEIKRLYDQLRWLDALRVDIDGNDGTSRHGKSLFGVYLADRTGPYSAFLWVNEDLAKSYVQWQHQEGDLETCRCVFADAVRNQDNKDGAELIDDIDCDTVLRLAKEYIAATGC